MSSQIFSEVDASPHYGQLTEKIITFWKEKQIFEKSVEQRSKENPYVFYDGPPFVTGLPHYGHLLSGIAKDLIPRYWAMKGKYVKRIWGWDCHGLPIENKVENKLGLKSRRDIETVGLERFIQECYAYVAETSSEWNWYVDHSGRWVDMDHAYRTMDLTFMESVLWVFKTIYDKGLIYKGKRVSLYCPHCGTPVSSFEIAMDNSYKELTEPANTYKFKLKNQDKTYILAWSTTPWNKLVTMALAVNPDYTYVKVKQNNEYYILAKSTFKMLTDAPYQIIEEISGKDLVGLSFEPHYDFYDIPKDKKAYLIVGGDFVTAEEGTGVVTLAVYGEDDFKVMQENNIALMEHVDEEGHLKINPKFNIQHANIAWNGLYYLKANKLVNEDLTSRGLMYREDPHTHTVPECWRCHTRLMYSPQDAWFLKVSEIKDQLLKTNENIYWFPEHIKHGRFKKGIESAPDWCISRSRYWATPMPVWICQGKPEGCGRTEVLGSIAEIEEKTKKKVTNLHRPYIDEYEYSCESCGGVMRRIPDVLDCWMESGSMPYGERHYPFENKVAFEASFPADYIVEYVAQTRAWFYVMHVISNALFNSEAFKNVICHGVIFGTDGRKMSKSYGNYPDPRKVLETHGGDAFRLYLMSSPIMAAENLNISEEEVKEQNSRVLNILWNSYKYFVTYANLHHYEPKDYQFENWKSKHVLDQWVVAKLQELSLSFSQHIEEYNIPKAVRGIRPFIQDLSTWYIRRSRDRFVEGDREALDTLFHVLLQLSQTIAPTVPFVAEELYLNLTTRQAGSKESVHLTDWQELKALTPQQKKLLADMELVRHICALGNEQRKKEQLPTRQPLAGVTVFSASSHPGENLLTIIQEELNVKVVNWVHKKDTINPQVELDKQVTPELEAEGEARKLIRQIQEARKQAGTKRDQYIIITLPSWPKALESEIKQKALVKEIRKGETLRIV